VRELPSNVVLGMLLVLIIGSLVAYSMYNSSKPQQFYNAVQPYVTEGIDQGSELVNQGKELLADTITRTNQVGDSLELSLTPNQVQRIQEERFDNQTLAYNGTIRQSNLNTEKGQTYGHTNLYDKPLPQNMYFIGNPVDIKFKLTKVIPDSCRVVNEIYICDYVTPAIFSFIMEITCEYRDFCSMSAPVTVNNKKTENDGTFSYTWQTGGLTQGKYMIMINANSEAIDQRTERPYQISLNQEVELVNP